MKAKYGTDSMGQTAENVAEQYGVTRADQDAFALRSQQKAAAARAAGRFAPEIAPVEIAQKKGDPKRVEHDEFIRPTRRSRRSRSSSPRFAPTARDRSRPGNSSGLNDGAAALLLASAGGVTRVRSHTGRARGRERGGGRRAAIMGMGPVPATRKALKLAGLTLDQMDVIELNEAFAAQSLACLRELGSPTTIRA